MSVHTGIVAVGQLLVGWAMCVPRSLVDGRWVLRGWRAYGVVVLGSLAVGLGSLIVGSLAGFVDPGPLPSACADVLPVRCCAAGPIPGFCFHPSAWTGQRLSGNRAGR